MDEQFGEKILVAGLLVAAGRSESAQERGEPFVVFRRKVAEELSLGPLDGVRPGRVAFPP
jgi:hypothetical protein